MSVYLIEKRDPGLIDAAREALVTQHGDTIKVIAQAERVSRSMALVLVQGESGTGKELLARFIHAASERKGPFIGVNCACLPDGLVESELFGHERGAFTGAVRRSVGWFEQAQGGTLLLDEISEMPMHLQAKLLRVLQEKEIFRVGSKDRVSLDVRIVATTNCDLASRVKEGRFREDLFHRINMMTLAIPPLRERAGDVPLLINHFLKKHGGERRLRLSGEAAAAMQGLMWRGNVRQLENVVAHGALLCEGECVEADDLGIELKTERQDRFPTVAEMQHGLMLRSLAETNGNRTQAAKLLGITVRTLRNWLKERRDELMPMYDYECPECGRIEEHIGGIDETEMELACGHIGRKIISVSGVNTANDDAAWLRSVREVVDKDPSKPHCQAFLKDPTRENYKRLLKEEGLRPVDPGEFERRKKPELDHERMARLGMEKLMKDRRVEVRG